jgi:hypothetical protein
VIGAWLALVIASTPVDKAGLQMGAVLGVPPVVGVVLSSADKPGVAIVFPWALKILHEAPSPWRPTQLVIEPGVIVRAATSFIARLGLRWMFPVGTWLALGGGLGGGVEVGPALNPSASLPPGVVAAPMVRPSSSIELIARIGKGPIGFGVVTTRFELRMDGSTAFLVGIGGAYW